jgi:hypothetical protein
MAGRLLSGVASSCIVAEVGVVNKAVFGSTLRSSALDLRHMAQHNHIEFAPVPLCMLRADSLLVRRAPSY